MKTLRSLFLICLIAALSISMANAQSPKVTGGGTYFQKPYYLPCFDELVSGVLNYEYMLVNSKLQEKIWGSLLGETTGNEYTLSQVFNDNWHPWAPGQVGIYTSTVSLKFRLDGKLVFILHLTYHHTVNSDGEFVVVHNGGFADCK